VRIGEAARLAELTPKALRFYEDRGLLPPVPRGHNGYRDYSPEMLPRLEFIRRGRAAGLALAEIGEVLAIRDAGHPPCHQLREVLAVRLAELDRQLAGLAEVRATVAELHGRLERADVGQCDPARVCSFL
jgi:MerR family copper efflux transcriptional regulator